MGQQQQPRFLAVRVGDLVAVQACGDLAVDWWLGQVIHAEGGARCNANSLFQIACVDTGVIRTVNADAVIEILTAAAGARKRREVRGKGASSFGLKARDVFGHELLVQCPVPARRRDARCVCDIAGRWRSRR